MKKLSLAALLLAFAGCLSSAPKGPTYWLIETADLPVMSSVAVNPPYDGLRFAVLRGDGSVVFDAYNSFAAVPSMLMRSVVRSREAPSLVIRRIALDARVGSQRDALVEVTLSDGKVSAEGIGRVSAVNGNYTAAFTEAIRIAVREAGEKLVK